MNKILITNFFIIVSLISCSTNHGKVSIKLKEEKLPVLVRLSKEDSTINFIKIPIKIKISNDSKNKVSFIKVDYEYGSLKKGYGLSPEIYTYNKKILNPLSNNKKNILTAVIKKNI